MKKKLKIKVNNKLREYGNEQGGKIEINVRKHRGDKAELADTIIHEMNHAKSPRASEKKIQQKTKIDMSKMSYAEKENLAKKLRHKSINYKLGAAKRRFKITSSDKVEPGDLIKRFKTQEPKTNSNSQGISREKLSIMGLV